MLPRDLLRSPALLPATKLVAAWISTFKRWWGKAQTIADELSLSLRSVQRALRQLSDGGWIASDADGLSLVTKRTGTEGTAQACPPPAEPSGQLPLARVAQATVVSPPATQVSRASFVDRKQFRKTKGRRRQGCFIDDWRAALLNAQRCATSGLGCGPLVVDTGTVVAYQAAVEADGDERVAALMRRVAEDASAGRIPARYWSRLFVGGGYAARRQTYAELDAAELRRRCTDTDTKPTEAPEGRPFDPKALLDELAPAWLRARLDHVDGPALAEVG